MMGKSTLTTGIVKKLAFVDKDKGGKKVTLTKGSGSVTGFAITDLDVDGNKVIADHAAALAGDSPLSPIPYSGKDPSSAKLAHPPIKSSAPEPPKPTITDGSHLRVTGSAPAGAHSITDAIDRTMRLVDDDTTEWTTSYGVADGDVIEDMHISTQMVEQNGQRFMEVRFRLDGDAVDKIRTSLTGAEQEYGDWEATPKMTTDLVVGDKVAVRVGHGGWLKPSKSTTAQAANATITGPPELLGTTEIGHPLYRVQVTLATGDVGYMNLEDRGSPSVATLDWDVDKPRPKKGHTVAELSGAAANAGWIKAYDQPGFEHDKANQINGFSMDSDGVKKLAGDYLPSGGNGGVFTRDVDGAKLSLTLTDTTRNVQDGRVLIRVPVGDEDPALSVARAMEAVGVTPEMQQPPDKDKLAKMALNKVAAQFAQFRKRGERTTATLGNPQAALSLIDKAIGKELGRPATLNDIEFQVLPDGQMRTRVSRDIAEAIVKKNKTTFYLHASGTGKIVTDSLMGRTSGALSAQQRAMNGVFKSGAKTIASDNKNGGGDRVFLEARQIATILPGSYGTRGILMDPVEAHRNLDYWYRDSDSFGRRFDEATPDEGYNWKFLDMNKASSSHHRNEFLMKHGLPTETWAGVLVDGQMEKEALKKKLEDQGKFSAPNGQSWDDFIRTGGEPAIDLVGPPDVGATVTLGGIV